MSQGFLHHVFTVYFFLYLSTLIFATETPDKNKDKSDKNIFVTPPSVNEEHGSPNAIQFFGSSEERSAKENFQGSRHDLQGSSTEVKRAAKSPLLLKLLQEQQQEDISNQLAYVPLSPTVHQSPVAYSAPEHQPVYYQQEQETEVPEYSEQQKETHPHKDIRAETPARYEYVYNVKDPEGHDFGHSESRLGDKTWGRYFVQLPDGREKTVRYWADDTGFHAEVQYKGHSALPSGGKKLVYI